MLCLVYTVLMSIELSFVLTLLNQIFLYRFLAFIGCVLGLDALYHLSIQIFIERQLPLQYRNLRVHPFLLVWRRIQWVEGYFQTRVNHIRYKLLQKGAASLKTGVGIDFDQVNSEIFIKHEVIPQYFKSVVLQSPRGRHDFIRRPEGISHNLFDL